MTESYSMTTAALEHVQAVAFDLDGTLCDSVPDLAAAAQAMCAHLGLPVLPTQTVEVMSATASASWFIVLLPMIVKKKPILKSGKKALCSL